MDEAPGPTEFLGRRHASQKLPQLTEFAAKRLIQVFGVFNAAMVRAVQSCSVWEMAVSTPTTLVTVKVMRIPKPLSCFFDAEQR